MENENFFEFQSRMKVMKTVIKINNSEKYVELSKNDGF